MNTADAETQRKRQNSAGFTLVELLVVMVVLSLIIAPVADIYIMGLQRWGSIYTRSAGLTQINSTLERMTYDITNAIAFVPETSGSNPVYTFIMPGKKDAQGVWQPVSVNAGLIYTNGSRVRYYLSDNTGSSTVTGGHILWRATAPNGNSSYTPDTSWSLSGRLPRCGSVQSLGVTPVGNLNSVAVQVAMTIQVTDGGKTTNYPVTRTFALLLNNASVMTFPLDPRATFLLVDTDPFALTPVVVDLAGRGINPGDKIRLEVLGGYSTGAGVADNAVSLTDFLFSSNSVVQAYNLKIRVTGAIASTAPAYISPVSKVNGLATDISQDFTTTASRPVTVTVPTGALFLLLGTADNFYGNHSDANGDYAVRITKL